MKGMGREREERAEKEGGNMKKMKTRKLELERGGKKAHHFSSSFLFFPSLSQLKNKMLRPVATVLLLSLLALAAGASATEDLSSGDAPPIGAVLIARKVCFFVFPAIVRSLV